MNNGGVLIFSVFWQILLVCPIFCNECQDSQAKAASLAKTCCKLTRPSIDSAYAQCDREMRETNPQLRNQGLERLAHLSCIYECLFIADGFMDADPPYLLDLESIGTHYRKLMPEPKDETVEFISEAYRKCEQFRKVHSSKLDIQLLELPNMETSCNPFAIQIATCVYIFGMQECPEQFYVKSAACKDAQNYFKNCLASVKRF